MRTIEELRQAQRALGPRFNGLRGAVQRLGYDAHPGVSMRDLERACRDLADLIAAELAKVDAIRAERAEVEAAEPASAETPVVREIREITNVTLSVNMDGIGIAGSVVDEIVRHLGPDGGAGAAVAARRFRP